MIKLFFPLCILIICASCTSQKYVYHFDHHNYSAGKAKQQPTTAGETVLEEIDLTLDDASLIASADNRKPVIVPEAAAEKIAPSKEEALRSYKEMSKAERKEFRKEAKTLMKNYVKAVKSGDEGKIAEASKAMDQDLKMAAIFGAVGLVALIIGGDVFWVIGGIALLIGVVFFVLWLSRQ